MDTATASATLAGAALAADPTNTGLQTANTAALGNLTAKTIEYTAKQNDHDSTALDSIDQSLKAMNNPNAPPGANASDTASLDANQTSTIALMQTGVTEGDFLSSVFSYPAESSCMTVPMNYKALNYTFDPCTKLATFRLIFGWCLYVMTAFTLYDIATKRA